MFLFKRTHLTSGTCIIPGGTFTIAIAESVRALASSLMLVSLSKHWSTSFSNCNFLSLRGF